MAEKKYFWLKLPEDFFTSPDNKPIKKLRRMAGGDTYTIIYLKLLLASLRNNGKIFYDSVEDTFQEEIAEEIGEDADNVLFTIQFLQRYGLIVEGDDEIYLPQLPEMVGKEGSSAERVRRFREREKQKQLPCNNNELQSNVQSLQCNSGVTNCNTEKEIDKDIDLYLDKDKKKEDIRSVNNLQDSSTLSTKSTPVDTLSSSLSIPSLDEMKKYVYSKKHRYIKEFNLKTIQNYVEMGLTDDWKKSIDDMNEWNRTLTEKGATT